MKHERWGAAAGLVAFILGAVAASFERGAPTINAPAQEVVDFFATYRTELLAQSLLFILSAGAWLWFLGSLRNYLLGSEGGTGRLSSVAFGAGVVGIGIQALIQAPQSALAMASSSPVDASVAAVMELARGTYAERGASKRPFRTYIRSEKPLLTRAFTGWAVLGSNQ